MRGGGRTKEIWKGKILSVLYPRTCPICQKATGGDSILACPSCREGLPLIRPPFCMKCGRPLVHGGAFCYACSDYPPLFDRNVSIWEYAAPIKQSLYRFKYGNKREYAAFYGREALRMYGGLMEKWQVEAVIPVPVHRSRYRQRGYNQAECFGMEVSRGLQIPLVKDCVCRRKKTAPQKALGPGQRAENLRDAFAVKKPIHFGTVLVADDIYTTGSTLNAMAEVLKRAGVKRVYCLTIAAAGIRP